MPMVTADGDRTGDGDKRAVEPLALGQDEGRWWLFAWCRRDRAGRPFPLDRITGAWLTTEHAPPRDIHAVFENIPADAFALSLLGDSDGR